MSTLLLVPFQFFPLIYAVEASVQTHPLKVAGSPLAPPMHTHTLMRTQQRFQTLHWGMAAPYLFGGFSKAAKGLVPTQRHRSHRHCACPAKASLRYDSGWLRESQMLLPCFSLHWGPFQKAYKPGQIFPSQACASYPSCKSFPFSWEPHLGGKTTAAVHRALCFICCCWHCLSHPSSACPAMEGGAGPDSLHGHSQNLLLLQPCLEGPGEPSTFFQGFTA